MTALHLAPHVRWRYRPDIDECSVQRSALRDTAIRRTATAARQADHTRRGFYTAPWGTIEIRFRLLRAQSGAEMPPPLDRSRNQQTSRRFLCLARR